MAYSLSIASTQSCTWSNHQGRHTLRNWWILNKWEYAQEDCPYVNFPSLLACQAKKWESLPSLPVKCTVVISHCGTLLTIGGRDAHSSTISNNVYACNAKIRSWVLVDKLEFGWSSMTTAMYNDDIIIVGGWKELADGKQERSKCVMIGRYRSVL